MTRLLIQGGRVIDPASGLDRRRDIVVEDGRIAAVCARGSPLARKNRGHRLIDASGLLVLPGLIDLHVHLRQPGMAAAETIRSGTRAAAAGGFTTVVCMPNTRPVLDRPARLRRLLAAIRRDALVRVLPAPALSLGLEGRRLSDIEAFARLGAAAVSDDGIGTSRLSLLERALSRASRAGLAVLCHCEDRRLSRGGAMTLGPTARRLGLPGITARAELVATRNAVRASRRGAGRVHVQHVSTRGALAEIRRAKRAGLAVTAEATPHHLFLTEADIERSCGRRGGPDPDLKMNPPLRTALDRQALREGLADGSIDAVASDHAPHPRSAKERGFLDAPFGVTGLETMLALVLRLAEEGVVTLARAVDLLTAGPARILGVDTGTLAPGAPADITLVDTQERWVVVPSRMKSRSSNTPFGGWSLKGRARYTLVGGRVVHPG